MTSKQNQPSRRDVSIRTRLLLLGAWAVGGIVATALALGSVVRNTSIDSPAYARIVQNKDLVADILPPPAYIIESYLVALQMVDCERDKLDALKTYAGTLRTDFEKRHGYWNTVLEPGPLKQLLTVTSYAPAKRFYDLRDGVFNQALARGDREEAVAIMRGPMQAAYDEHRKAIDEIVVLTNKRVEDDERAAQTAISDGARLAWAVAVPSVLLAIFLSAWILRSVTGPLEKLRDSLLRVRRDGSFNQRIAIEAHDEVGDAGDALNGLFEEVGSLVADVSEVLGRAAEGRFGGRVTAKATGELGAIKDNVNRFLEQLEDVLGSIREVMAAVAEGDLRARVDIEAAGALAEIRDNINRSLSSLATSLDRVATTVRQVAIATNDASGAVGQVADGAGQQLNALKHISVGMTQTSQAVYHVSSSARDSSRLAREAAELVASGSKGVENVVQVVGRIREQSEQVSRITDVISQLASQTNMLSLNAAIEAARAGEHGKGFAVVAEQVGRLAESSGKSVKEIVELLARAAKETQVGVASAESLRESFTSVASRVAESDCMAGTIASAMEEQQSAIAQINQSVADLTRIGQSNAAASEEIAGAMIELSRLSQQTRSDIDRFRTK